MAYHHGDLRKALVAEASKAVGRDGHERLSLRAVAGEVGVSHVAAVHHFANREGLLAAVATAALDEMTEVLRKAGAVEDPRAAFRGVGAAYFAWAAKHAGLYRLTFASGAWRTMEHPELSAGLAKLVEVVASVIARGQAAGIHRAGAPADLALFAWSAVHGATLVALDNPQLVKELAGTPARLSALVLDGIFTGAGTEPPRSR